MLCVCVSVERVGCPICTPTSTGWPEFAASWEVQRYVWSGCGSGITGKEKKIRSHVTILWSTRNGEHTKAVMFQPTLEIVLLQTNLYITNKDINLFRHGLD